MVNNRLFPRTFCCTFFSRAKDDANQQVVDFVDVTRYFVWQIGADLQLAHWTKYRMKLSEIIDQGFIIQANLHRSPIVLKEFQLILIFCVKVMHFICQEPRNFSIIYWNMSIYNWLRNLSYNPLGNIWYNT